MVDAASTEGRDPIADIYAINKELEAYNPELCKKPQVIAANKIDAIYPGDEDPVEKLRQEFEPQGIPVYPISAVSGQGLKRASLCGLGNCCRGWTMNRSYMSRNTSRRPLSMQMSRIRFHTIKRQMNMW